MAELEAAEELTQDNTGLTLVMCVNYGGRAEILDAAGAFAADAVAGRVSPQRLREETFRRYLDEPDMPDVDLFVRSSGEQRTSNFLLWQSAYAELVFLPDLWPDVDRRQLWAACEQYAHRDRRVGGRRRPGAGGGGAGRSTAPTPGVALDHVQVLVAPGRTDAAVAFYERLGLRRVPKAGGSRASGAWLVLPDGVTQVHVSERDDAARHPEQHLALRTPDLDGLVARLRAAGDVVDTDRPPSDGHARAMARDPDGNGVELLQA